mgnify:CR=1 FL=1
MDKNRKSENNHQKRKIGSENPRTLLGRLGLSSDSLLEPDTTSSPEKVASAVQWAASFRSLPDFEKVSEGDKDNQNNSGSSENVSEETSDSEDEPDQVPALIVDNEGSPANREGTTVMCSAKKCAHNISGSCSRDTIRLDYNGQKVTCRNFQPMQPTKGVENPSLSSEQDD